MSMTIHPSDRRSILALTADSLSTVSKTSRSSPRSKMRPIATCGSTSTRTFVSGMGRIREIAVGEYPEFYDRLDRIMEDEQPSAAEK